MYIPYIRYITVLYELLKASHRYLICGFVSAFVKSDLRRQKATNVYNLANIDDDDTKKNDAIDSNNNNKDASTNNNPTPVV